MRNTFITVFLILIAFSLGLAVDKSKIAGLDNINPELTEDEVLTVDELDKEPDTAVLEYKSPLGFSFLYDSSISLENSSIVLPGGTRVAAAAAVRYVNQQRCSESGLPEHCRAFLENPAVAFGVLEENFDALKNNKLKDVLQFSEPITLSGKTGIQYYAGVEGEGIVTIILPFKSNQTFLIQYTFDEMYDSVKNNPDIFNSEEQKFVVDHILSTLKLE
jgi:hypothetical protein